MNNEDEKPEVQPEAPESFPPEVLRLPAGVRQEYFEQRCLISHPRLLQALETTLQEICPPDEVAGTRRPGTMVLVIGPSRVGKTTLIRLLEERLRAVSKERMLSDPSFIPVASILAAGPGTNRFEWTEYYRAVLRALHDPFVDGKVARIRTRELREAMETALCERKPLAIIVDEAHHLAEPAKTVTLTHLRKTALSEMRVELALRNALESEAELTEPDGADERLLTLLGLRGPGTTPQSKAKTDEQPPSPLRQDRPGKRSPGRDATGQKPDEDASEPLSGEEKVG